MQSPLDGTNVASLRQSSQKVLYPSYCSCQDTGRLFAAVGQGQAGPQNLQVSARADVRLEPRLLYGTGTGTTTLLYDRSIDSTVVQLDSTSCYNMF
jgi:hypothetical protein